MTTAMVFGLCGAGAAGLGLYGVIVNPRPLRKISRFQSPQQRHLPVLWRCCAEGRGTAFNGDPVPQALVITGIVVAAAGTALAVALLLRLFKETGSETLGVDAVTRKATDFIHE